MRTTIDGAGRIVVPKSLRDAMGLSAGSEIDVIYTDGRLEIEFAPASVAIDDSEGFPRLTSDQPMPALDDDTVRAVLESTRR